MFTQTELETKVMSYIGRLLVIGSEVFEMKMKVTDLLKRYPKDPTLLELQKRLSEAEKRQNTLVSMMKELKELLAKKQYGTLATKSISFYLVSETQFRDVDDIKTKLYEFEKVKPLYDIKTFLPYVLAGGLALFFLIRIRR